MPGKSLTTMSTPCFSIGAPYLQWSVGSFPSLGVLRSTCFCRGTFISDAFGCCLGLTACFFPQIRYLKASVPEATEDRWTSQATSDSASFSGAKFYGNVSYKVK